MQVGTRRTTCRPESPYPETYTNPLSLANRYGRKVSVPRLEPRTVIDFHHIPVSGALARE